MGAEGAGRRHGGEHRGEVGALQCFAHLAQGRGDHRELDRAQHVLRFGQGGLIERVGHRDRGVGAAELDEHAGAQLAESPRQLLGDRGRDRGGERDQAAVGKARERAREHVLGDEPRVQDRVRERLLRAPAAVDLLHLIGAQQVGGDQHLGELRLSAGARAIRTRRPSRSERRGLAHHSQDFVRRLVLRYVRDRPEGERLIADARVEREEDDLGLGKSRPQLLGDLEPGHTRHRVVEEDQIWPELERHAHRVVSVDRLPDDVELGIGIDEGAQSLSDRRVVIRDQHPRGHGLRLGSGAFADIPPWNDVGMRRL